MERIKLNIQRFASPDEIQIKLTATVNELEKQILSANKTLGVLKSQIKDTTVETNKFKNAASEIKNAFNKLDLSSSIKGLKSVFSSLYKDFLTKSIDVSEELNLFNVVFNNIEKNGKTTFSTLGREATQFQNKMNEAFGTNKKDTMRYQGLFQAMGESAGLDDRTSALMSRNMTKLAYDLASLYNTTETKAAESLRAGVYAGQTKPLRNYGIDVTQTSYKPLMEELGLEKSVSELTQAEKEILRYISTLRQAQNAMGDFANTIESPANQLKVLRQQFYEMQAAIGNLFVGAFAKILPYANAIIMVVKEVAKTIASIFGIEMSDYNTGIATYDEGLEDYSESLDGVAGSAGGASDAIKALKRQTLGFDQINNLVSPTPTSSSGGGGGGSSGGILGGIDDRLLAALREYDNGMGKVKMKATEIRDKIMDILGFTKHINYETGETYFTYDGWKETVKGLWNWFKDLNPIAKIFVGLGVPAAFVTLFNAIKKILGLTGITGLFKSLLGPISSLTGYMWDCSKAAVAVDGGLKNLGSGLSVGIDAWREQQGIIDKTTGKLNGFTGVVQGAKNVLLGLGEAVVGVTALSASVDDLTKNGANLGNVIGTAGGTLMTVFGGVQAGAVFGPWGAVIGGVIGAVTALGAAILAANTELELEIETTEKSIEATEKSIEARVKAREAREEDIKSSVAMSEYNERLLKELGGIIDENGKVKEGYEERAQFIVTTLADAYGVELSYSDGIVNGYKEQKDAIQDLIDKEQEQIYLEAYHDEAVQAIKDRKAALEDLTTAQQDLTDAHEQEDQAMQELTDSTGEYYKNFVPVVNLVKSVKEMKLGIDLLKTSENADKAQKNITAAYEELYQTYLDEDRHQRALVASTNGNMNEFKKIQSETLEDTKKAFNETLASQSQTLDNMTPDIVEKWKVLGQASMSEYNEYASQLPADVQKYLFESTGVIYLATPEMVAKFQALGEQSEDAMVEEIKKLPTHLQNDVIDKLKEKGAKIPDELQKGIDSKPKPKVNLETSSKQEVQSKVNSATSGVSGNVNVNANMPSTWSMQNSLNNNLRGVSGVINIAFGTGSGGGFRANGGVFANGRWQPIQAYANGGLPSGGQIFIAREAGPELVGKIGKHTAVMNNNQIVDSVKAGVYEAVSAAMSQGGMGSVQIDLHTDEGVVVDRINRITRQTGTCPIDI